MYEEPGASVPGTVGSCVAFTIENVNSRIIISHFYTSCFSAKAE